jgi:hypothetical protein
MFGIDRGNLGGARHSATSMLHDGNPRIGNGAETMPRDDGFAKSRFIALGVGSAFVTDTS